MEHEVHTENINHWSLDKRVNISHMLATTALLLGLFQWGNKMDTRVTTLEANLISEEAANALLYKRLERIEDKLDRLIEKAP